MKLYAAPLQGFTEAPWRNLHQEVFGGIDAYYTPFVRMEKGEFRNKDVREIASENNTVSRLIPQLMACGVEILNPIQPTGEDMQPAKLKAAFGNQIVFHGGLDTQSVLPGGTEESVRESVFALLDAMQPGGGYIFAAAHNLQGDVPPENIVAMFKAARAWKGK